MLLRSNWISSFQTDPSGTLITLAYTLFCVLFSLILHECAHGWVALKCGDPTARNLGRLTLDPVKHLDPVGSICMLLFGFGWAKPVPVNSRNFRHFRKDYIFVSLAGIITNLFLCLLSLLVAALLSKIIYEPILLDYLRLNNLQYTTIDIYHSLNLNLYNGNFSGFYVYNGEFDVLLKFVTSNNQWVLYIQRLFLMLANMNLSLAIFNFLPVPPLDGYRFLDMFVFRGKIFIDQRKAYIIQIIFMVLLFTGLLNGFLSTIIGSAYSFFSQLIGIII